MTKQECNRIIESVWEQQLQRVETIPKDIAAKYSTWLRGKIQQAASLLQADGGAAAQIQGGEQGGPDAQQGAGAPQ